MDKKTIIAAVIISVVISLVFGGFLYSGKVGPQGPGGKQGVGGFPGPDITSEFLIFNGFEVHSAGSRFQQGTTTVCALKSPTATSTLVFASVQDNDGTNVATQWSLNKDSTRFGSTTALLPNLGEIVFIANNYVTIFATPATTSIAADELDFIFAPDQFFTVHVQGVGAAGLSNAGRCNAQWVVTGTNFN